MHIDNERYFSENMLSQIKKRAAQVFYIKNNTHAVVYVRVFALLSLSQLCILSTRMRERTHSHAIFQYLVAKNTQMSAAYVGGIMPNWKMQFFFNYFLVDTSDLYKCQLSPFFTTFYVAKIIK